MGTAKTVGILQPGYFPWLGCFEQIERSDVFILYDDVQFAKGSWVNRNRIKGPNGLQWLTVPVLLKDKGFLRIDEVEVNQKDKWIKKTIRSIAQCYARSPFFETYSPEIFDIISRPWKYLIELNVALLEILNQFLGVETPIIRSSSLEIPGSNVERLIQIVKHLNGTTFYEGAAGKNYIDPVVFEKEGLTIQFQEYKHPVYKQINGEFISHLSVIDLLFNCGSSSLSIIMNK